MCIIYDSVLGTVKVIAERGLPILVELGQLVSMVIAHYTSKNAQGHGCHDDHDHDQIDDHV